MGLKQRGRLGTRWGILLTAIALWAMLQEATPAQIAFTLKRAHHAHAGIPISQVDPLSPEKLSTGGIVYWQGLAAPSVQPNGTDIFVALEPAHPFSSSMTSDLRLFRASYATGPHGCVLGCGSVSPTTAAAQPTLWAIPQGGHVLQVSPSAWPALRDLLQLPKSEHATPLSVQHTKALPLLALVPQWFAAWSFPIAAINPTLENNARGCSFPGCRGGQQLVVYTGEGERQHTGTNEFGYEITAIRDTAAPNTAYRIIAAEGADSAIPAQGLVASGHGKARNWLAQHGAMGSRVTITPIPTVVPKPLALKTLAPKPALKNPKGPMPLLKKPSQPKPSHAVPLKPTTVATSVSPTPTLPSAPPPQQLTIALDAQAYAERYRAQQRAVGCVEGAAGTETKTPFLCALSQKQYALALVDIARAQKQPDANARDKALAMVASRMAQAEQDLARKVWEQGTGFLTFPSRQHPIRAVWHRPIEKSPAHIGLTLDRFQRAGLNTVFLETYFHGFPIFPSHTFSRYGLPNQYPTFRTSGDVLAQWITQAHARGMAVHAWLEVFYAGNKTMANKDFPTVGPILDKYPQWANTQFSARATTTLQPSSLELGGYFLDPANPEVQTFLLALVDELRTRYDLDGIQLDYIRYPACFPNNRLKYLDTTWGYTPVARDRFKAQTGFDPLAFSQDKLTTEQAELWEAWSAFREAQINGFVQAVHERLHAPVLGQPAKRLVLSVDIFAHPEESRQRKHQHWAHWLRSGWLDWIVPLTLTSAERVVGEDVRRIQAENVLGIPVLAGVFGPYNNNMPQMTLTQCRTAAQAGANGYALFDSAHLTPTTLQAFHVATQADYTTAQQRMGLSPAGDVSP